MRFAIRSRAAIVVGVGGLLVIAVAVVAFVTNLGRGPASGSDECPEALPLALVDEARGVALCLPSNWREIRADDDAAWRELYGEREADAERWIRDGTMDHFIVPLEPRDEDPLVNLAIYSEAVEPATGLAELREAYVSVLESTGSKVDVTTDVDLEASPAVLIEGERPRDSEGTLVVDRFLDWIVVHDDVAFYVLFASDRTFAYRYRSTFEAIANSVRFTDTPGE